MGATANRDAGRLSGIRRRIDRLFWLRRENMPADLRGGRLVLSEQDIRTRLPVPLHGRPDQVFASAEGLLVVTDTKARLVPRVTWPDVLQLSVYGTILAFTDDPRAAGMRVAAHGYIRFPTPGGVVWARVPLLRPATVVELWTDYWLATEAPSGQAA